MKRAADLAGLAGDYRVVTYHRPSEFRNNLYTRGPAAAPSTRTDGDWAALMDRAGIHAEAETGFHYLWWPAAP